MLLYADENFPLAVVEELRRVGHDVLTAQEDGRANLRISDESVLARATELKRAVLTINRRDFRWLHDRGGDHAGIFSCTFDPDFARQAGRIIKAAEEVGEVGGKLINVYRPAR
jgi:hypothetical protein